MRVLQVAQSLARGGAERILLELAAALQAEGHPTLVALLVEDHEHPEPAYRSVETRVLLPREAFRWPYYVPRAASRLARIVREWKPDVLLVHTPNAAYVAAAAALPAPAVWVVHWYWEAEADSALKTFRRRVLARWAFARAGRRGIVVAPPLIADSSRYLRCSPDCLRCVVNGIDLARFPFVTRDATDAPDICTVGSLVPLKRPELAIRAFAALRASFPRARLRVVGDGPLRPVLAALREEHGLGECVEFMGVRQDVPGILARSHLYWHFSRSEGFGLAVAEAMATGLPVVGSDAPGTRDLVAHGETGFIVPQGDPAAVAESTAAILADPAAYRRMGRAARAVAEERFGLDRMVRGYLEAAAAAADGRW